MLIRRVRPRLRGVAVAVAVVAAIAVWVLMASGVVDIVMKAAGIPSNATGLGGFVNGAHALVTPALVMVAAIAPLALIVGAVILLFGGRRGMQIVGTSIGVLLLLAASRR